MNTENKAADLIQRIEKQTGQRVDSNDFNNDTVLTLMGALSREMGTTNFKPEDDLAVGVLVRHHMSPEYKRQQAAMKSFCDMMTAGVDPEVARLFAG